MRIYFAHRHPERVQGLILVGSAARFLQSEDYPIGLTRRAMESVSEQRGRGTLRQVLMPSVTREQLDDETYVTMERLIGPRDTVRQVVAMMIETGVRALLPEVPVPVLVPHFAGDLAIPIRLGRALAEGLPSAEFVEVNAVDHADLSQSPEAIARIRAFCARAVENEAGLAAH